MYQRASRPLILGVEHSNVPPLEAAIEEITVAGMCFLVTPVQQGFTPPPGNRTMGLMTDAFGSINSEMTLRCDTWTRFVVVKIDSHFEDQQVPCVGRDKGLLDLIKHMKQLGVRAVMFNLRNTDSADLANVLGAVANSEYPIPIWVQVAMDSKAKPTPNFKQRKGRFLNRVDDSQSQRDDAEKDYGNAQIVQLPNPWHCWSTLHEKLQFSQHVRLVLELPVLVPDGETVKRWLAEPLAAVVIPVHLFYERSGMPALAYPHQRVLVDLVNHTNAVVIVGGRTHHPLEAYASYLKRVWHRRHVPIGDKMYNHAEGWADQVQFPLQPLEEDLEVRSYMLLEKDSVKYALYEKAVMEVLRRKKALKELNLLAKPPSRGGDKNKILTPVQLYRHSNGTLLDEIQLKLIRVAVLGAGRGPMVSIVLNAATNVNANVKVYAIEKNSAAVLSLETRKACDWIGHDVEILKEDFRLSTFSPKCDVAICELLGSWGDNELAPECIDGATNILRDDCTYVPCRYTSYVAPTCSSKVWAAAKAGGNSSFFRDDEKYLETIWVCYMKNKMDLGEPKALFTFEHPAAPVVEDGVTVMERDGVPKVDHARSSTLTWMVNIDTVLHGFAGYFHCSLFEQSCVFNTLPRTHTEGLITWFPVFIPLKKPMRLSKGCILNATFWRNTDVGRVWYEWMAEVGEVNSGVHNVKGRSCVMNCAL